MRRPPALQAHNPGLKESLPGSIPTGKGTPAYLKTAHYLEHEAGHLKKVGMNAAKSAGHAAHDALHRIGL